ncbi:MAG: hypothetical protein HYV16_07035 [Gammaproteobacteria bacterium]|nr:hypothetical protein [Gammaproteobacteria bacterium]
MRLITLSTLVFALAFGSAAQAGANTPRVDERQENQERRIEQGVDSGELTRREERRLERGQDKVERIEDRAKADGRVTKRERVRLDQAQDVQSKRIAKQKHDRQDRPQH